MAGNVWEWVADWYDAGYYANSPDENPPGPDLGDGRVVRGGPFVGARYDVRCTNRIGDHPDDVYRLKGFRLVSLIR